MSVGHWIEGSIGLLLLAVLLGAFVWWVYYLIKFFVFELYRHVRYTQKGLCPNRRCHKPLIQTVRPVDQLYGPSQIIESVCTCGSKPLPQGNRRFADWADY